MALLKNRRKASASKHAPGGDAAIELGSEQGENEFAQALRSGHVREDGNQKVFVMVVILVALYAFALVVPKDIVHIIVNEADNGYSLSWFILSLQENLNGLLASFTGNTALGSNYTPTIIRYIVIAFTGAGMALCGAVYQGSFKNALVSPSTLGVMSGATIGMMVYVVFLYDSNSVELFGSSTSAASVQFADIGSYLMSSYSLAFCSFAGCLVVVGLVLLVMKLARGGTSGIMIIITGQVVGGVIGAITNTIRYYYLTVDTYGEKAELLTSLQIASFYRNYTWIDLLAIAIPLVITFLVVMHLRQRMMMLSLDEAEQRSMGINTKRMTYALVGLCTLLTAILVSFCGQVGFVGFLVPHLARRLVGPNYKYLLPAATVMGAIFVLGAYTLLAMTLGSDYETMVGMFISIAGAAVFLVTALRGGGATRGEFK